MKLEFAVLFVVSTTMLVVGLKTEKFIMSNYSGDLKLKINEVCPLSVRSKLPRATNAFPVVRALSPK